MLRRAYIRNCRPRACGSGGITRHGNGRNTFFGKSEFYGKCRKRRFQRRRGGVGLGDSESETEASISALEEAATTPLFEGSVLSSMGTTYLLLNSAKLHGCSDVYMDELFRTMSKAILPQPNSLPSSYREASEYMKRLGHSYSSYDVCPNSCRVYRGAMANSTFCPSCRAPRKKRVGKSMVPQNVLRVFPLTPRLKRIFRSPLQAAAMTWSVTQQRNDGIMKHVSHSKQWLWINERYQ